MKDTSSEYIKYLFSHDSGVRLLHSRNGAEIISFYYSLFRQEHVQTVSEEEFELRLTDYLRSSRILLDETGEQDQQESLSIDTHGECETLAELRELARLHINRWASEKLRYIRRIRTDEGNYIELSASVERILSFVEDLEGQPFVGTESRFLDILHRLRDLAENTTENPEQRIQQLKEQRAQLKKQIEEILVTGQTYTYSANQITERLIEISRNARNLLSDFRQTEENFRKIIASLYNETDYAESGKGKVLGYTLDANRKLRDSPQGQSFASFWNFLAQDSGKNEINNLTATLLRRIEEQGIIWNDDFLVHLKSALHDAGKKIVNTNRLLADRLNRLLARQEEENRQLIVQHIHAIKNLAARCIEHPPENKQFMEVCTRPDLFFPQSRYAVLPVQEPEVVPMKSADANINFTSEMLFSLFNQFYIDPEKIRETIAAFRKMHGAVSQFTLGEIIAEFPVQKGLAEIIGYVSLAAESTGASILDNDKETIRFLSVDDKVEMEITLPKVVFI